MTINLPQLIIDSPFQAQIPEKMVWTASSLKLFRSCRRKFYWKYLMRLRPYWKDKNLMIGSGFHHSLGLWYRGKKCSMAKIAAHTANQLSTEATESQPFLGQQDFDDLQIAMMSFRGMMEGYALNYIEDRAQWQIERSCIERKFIVPCGDFDLSGRIDLIVRLKPKSSRKTLVEHKTSSKIRPQYLERLPLDTQIRAYIFGATRGFGVPVNEVLYDVVQKCKLRRKGNESVDDFTRRIAHVYQSEPSRYFYREPIPFEKHNIDVFEYELHQTHKEYTNIIKGQFGDPADPRSWGPNDKVCDEYFRACDYIPLCTQSLNKGTSRMFQQTEHMHTELGAEDDD